MSFLVRYEMLGLLVKALTASHEYSGSNKDNLPLPVQMQLPEKLQKIFQIFIAFLESALNFEHFEHQKQNESHGSSISEVIDSQIRVYFHA